MTGILVQSPGNVLLLLGAVAVTRDQAVFLDIKVALDVDRRVDQRLQLAAGAPGALDPDHVKAGWHVDRAGPAVLDQAGGRKCTASPRHRGCSTFSAIAAPQSKHAWVQAMSSACTAAGRDCLLQALDQDGLASTAPPVNRDHARATLHLRRHLAQPPEHAVQQLHLPAAGFDLTRVQPHLSLAIPDPSRQRERHPQVDCSPVQKDPDEDQSAGRRGGPCGRSALHVLGASTARLSVFRGSRR